LEIPEYFPDTFGIGAVFKPGAQRSASFFNAAGAKLPKLRADEAAFVGVVDEYRPDRTRLPIRSKVISSPEGNRGSDASKAAR
jgi:hypothetical protein